MFEFDPIKEFDKAFDEAWKPYQEKIDTMEEEYQKKIEEVLKPKPVITREELLAQGFDEDYVNEMMKIVEGVDSK